MSGLSYYNRGILPPAIENTHSAFLLHDIDGKIYHKTKWISRCSFFHETIPGTRKRRSGCCGSAAVFSILLHLMRPNSHFLYVSSPGHRIHKRGTFHLLKYHTKEKLCDIVDFLSFPANSQHLHLKNPQSGKDPDGMVRSCQIHNWQWQYTHSQVFCQALPV